jgi:FlaA1/EpsC-like NDP-sugar epimerase
MDSAGTRDLLGDKPYNGSTLSIATPNAIRNKEFLFLFWLFNFMVLSLARVVGYQLFYYVRSRGKNLRNLVIVGESVDAVALGNRIEQETSLGYRLLRIINAKENNDDERITYTRPT